MARPARPWFRFYVEAVSDRKIRRFKPEARWLWVAMLAAARESPTPGALLVAEDAPMSRAELADYAGVPLALVTRTLPLMVSLGMVTIDGDLITLPNFTARQFESDNSTERVRAHRERSKKRSTPVPSNTPESEADTETEIRATPVSQSLAERLGEDGLTRIARATNGDQAHALRTAQQILAKAPASVRDPAAYCVATVLGEPERYRARRGNPKKGQDCPTHAGQWADSCSGCAADSKAAS